MQNIYTLIMQLVLFINLLKILQLVPKVGWSNSYY